jgi:hypothetical protein
MNGPQNFKNIQKHTPLKKLKCKGTAVLLFFYKLDYSINYLIKLMRRRIAHHNPSSVNARKGKC